MSYELRRFYGTSLSDGTECCGDVIEQFNKKDAFNFICNGMKYGLNPKDLSCLYAAVGSNYVSFLDEKFPIDIYLGSGISISDYYVAMDLSWALNDILWDGTKIRVPERHRGEHFIELERKSDNLLVYSKFTRFLPNENTITIELEDLEPSFQFLLEMEESLRNNPNFASMAMLNLPIQIQNALDSLTRSQD